MKLQFFNLDSIDRNCKNSEFRNRLLIKTVSISKSAIKDNFISIYAVQVMKIKLNAYLRPYTVYLLA